MKIYVGNLPYDATEDDLRSAFSAFGNVESVSVITDKYSGRSKGFAFIEMPNVSEGQAAINGMNGKSMKDRTLVVNAARPPSTDRGGSYGRQRSGGFSKGRDRRY